jgi:hypothetical protein
MRRVCRGNWADNVHPLLVFSDDGRGGADSDLICYPCLQAMREKLAEEQKAKEATK